MPGPVKHAMITKFNAEQEKLTEERYYQRILGAIIADTPVIEKEVHSAPMNLRGHADHEDILIGIEEHVEMDDFHHKKLKLYFGHEVKEVYDDARLFLKGKGNGIAELHEDMLRSIEYGQKNIDEVGRVVSDMCGTDYKQTKEGIKKHLKLVKGYLTFLNRLFS